MRYANLIAFVILFLTRGLYYLWIVFKLCLRFYKEKAWIFFSATIVVCIIFEAHNVFLSIIPFYEKTVKWFKKELPAENELSLLD